MTTRDDIEKRRMICEEVCENEENFCKTTCCCGGDIDHPWDGHSPVSMHWWYCEGNCERNYAEGEPV